MANQYRNNQNKNKMLKLGTIVTDKVTGIEGMLTVHQTDMSGNQHYSFQPAGLNPEDRQPLDIFWVTEKRIEGAQIVSIKLPLEILGTEVEDKATKFKGTAIALYYYLNGCIHVEVKPKGVIEKTKQSIKSKEFDLRRLRGAAIQEMNEEELEKSKVIAPSPENHPSLFNS